MKIIEYIGSRISPRIETGYLRKQQGQMSLWQYSEGYRMPLIGGVKAYRDSRTSGASAKDALRDACTVQYLTVATILIGGNVANFLLIPID